jgi:hypothetical protein
VGRQDPAQKERARLISQPGSYLCRQRPTLPHTFACSTIGPAGLNCRVRDGNGWNPRGKITDVVSSFLPAALRCQAGLAEARLGAHPSAKWPLQCLKDREDETSQLNRLGVAYFLVGLFPISATSLLRLFVGATVSVLLLSRPGSNNFLTTFTVPVQFRTDNRQLSTEVLSTENCFLHRVNFMVKPNGRLVQVSFTHYCAFTSCLSTR